MRTPMEALQALYNISSRIVPLEELDEIVAPDFRWIDAPMRIDWQGIEEIRPRLAAAVQVDRPSPGVDCLEYYGNEQCRVVRWLWRADGNAASLFGLEPGAGTFEIHVLGLVTCRDGHLTSLEEFWDGADLLRRFGADVPKPETPE